MSKIHQRKRLYSAQLRVELSVHKNIQLCLWSKPEQHERAK